MSGRVCLACGVPLARKRWATGRLEDRKAWEKRVTCGPQCGSAHGGRHARRDPVATARTERALKLASGPLTLDRVATLTGLSLQGATEALRQLRAEGKIRKATMWVPVDPIAETQQAMRKSLR